jgi:hypothetical protein
LTTRQGELAPFAKTLTLDRSTDDTGVKPFIAVEFRNHGLLLLAGVLGSEGLPGPTRIGDVLRGVTVALRVRCPKVEWPEVHCVMSLGIEDSKREAEKAPLDGLAAPERVNLVSSR